MNTAKAKMVLGRARVKPFMEIQRAREPVKVLLEVVANVTAKEAKAEKERERAREAVKVLVEVVVKVTAKEAKERRARKT